MGREEALWRCVSVGAGVLQCQGFKLNRGAGGGRPSPHPHRGLQPDAGILSMQDPADTRTRLPPQLQSATCGQAGRTQRGARREVTFGEACGFPEARLRTPLRLGWTEGCLFLGLLSCVLHRDAGALSLHFAQTLGSVNFPRVLPRRLPGCAAWGELSQFTGVRFPK